MSWSAGYRARAGLPLDTMDKADTGPVRSASAGIVTALSAVSCPPRTVVNGSWRDAAHSVDCVSSVASYAACAIDLGNLPSLPCPTCGGGLWWRVSTVEPDGPGPWCCHQCQRPDPVVWIDATATEPSRPPATEEPDEPLWPDPGTPERERLDRKNAAICAGLLAGYHRHRAALAAKKSLVGGYRRAEAPGCWPGSSTIGGD